MGSALGASHHRWIIWPLADELVSDPYPIVDWVNATLLIPIVSSLIAWIALDEALTAIQLGAIGLVIVALSVIVTSQRNPTPTPPPTAPLTSSTTDSLSGDAKPTSPPNP